MDNNERYAKEFEGLQAYRKECKALAKEMLGLN